MFVKLRSKALRLVFRFGGYQLARAITRNEPKILMYHRFSNDGAPGSVSARDFERQVRFIKKHFRAVTMSQLADDLFVRKGRVSNAVAITIDDGYSDFYSLAWPILKKYNVPATFYVTTGFVSGELWLWPDQLRWVMRQPGNLTAGIRTLMEDDLDVESDPVSAYWKINAYLLTLPDVEKHEFLRSLAQAVNVEIPFAPPPEFAPVTWEQLRELQAGGVEIGGHTVSHPSLARVSLEQAKVEIEESARTLDRRLSGESRSFCYPNGTVEDFVPEHVPIIIGAGYTCAPVAFADKHGQAQRFAMRRYGVSGNWGSFQKVVNGAALLQDRLKRREHPTPYSVSSGAA